MSLHAQDMQRLERHAREIATRASLTYLADALRCLCDTRDPIEALALLRALWGSSHARRDNQRAALEEAGRWLEERIRREPGISSGRLALELGWLIRLVSVHGTEDDDRGDGDRSSSRHGDPGSAPFGAHIELLRDKRRAALARAATAESPAPQSGARDRVAPSQVPRPECLPDAFESRFASWQDAHEAFKQARKRRKQNKPLKDRLLDVVPVADELQHLATDLACSMLQTDGMSQLLDRPGDLPTFWIAVADLTTRDGKRVPSRISFAPAGAQAP